MKKNNLHIELLQIEMEALIKLGRVAEAKELLETSLTDEPSNSKLHYYLGEIYFHYLRQNTMAESHYRLAIKFGPPCPEAFIGLSTLLSRTGRIVEAEKVARQSLAFGSCPARAFEALGNIYEYSGKYLLARRYYKLALRNSMKNDFIFVQRSNLKRCRIKMFMF